MEIKHKNKNRVYERKQSLDLGQMAFGKVAPQVRELESAILGAIMLERNAFDLVSSILSPESFYVEANQRVFKAIRTLAAKNVQLDEFIVAQEMLANGDLEIAGGAYYISKLTHSVVSAANIEYHARIVAQKYIQRQLIQLGGEMCTESYEDTVDVFDLLDSVDGKLSAIISGNNQKALSPVSSAIVKSIQRIEELRVLDSHLTGIPAGFTELDNITHGWQNTDLIILAARPSVGKTAFAGNVIVDAAKHFYSLHLQKKKIDPLAKPKSVAFFSLEMSEGQLVNRMLSAESEIWLDNISNGKLNDAQMEILYRKAVEVISALPIFIDDTAALNTYELKAKCRQLKNKNDLGLVVIDYLQLMSGSGDKAGNREQEISKISRDLKALAKELNIPIIALSQLSREPEKRKGEGKMPQLSDLRESGAIEQDADMVMFLYRPEYHDITANEWGDSNKGETHVRIAKHRNGTLANIKLKANLAIQKFSDYDSFEVAKEHLGAGKWAPAQNYSEPLGPDELPF